MKTFMWKRTDEQDLAMDLTPRECSDCKSGTRFEVNLESAEDITLEPASNKNKKRFSGLINFGRHERECLLDDSRLFPA